MSESERATAIVRAAAPGRAPRIGLILGSGWNGVTEHVTDPVRIAYAELPGFPTPTVAGHGGELWLGRIGRNEVAVLSGRRHAYESGDAFGMNVPVQTLRALGCSVLVQTNAAGSLRPQMPPGSLMLLSDHINLSQRSPLVGATGSDRFVDMINAYDPRLRAGAHAAAAALGIELHEGVYVWYLGPQFETPAEIRMFQHIGGDAVGMSTVPETILARHAGMRVLAVSLLTNMAAGLSDEVLSHAHTLAQAQAASAVAGKLLAGIVETIEIDR